MSTTQQTSSTAKRPTLEQLLALAYFIAGVLAKLSFERVQYLIEKKNTILRQKLMEVFEIANDEFAEVRTEWEEFYKTYLGIIVDFSAVVIPPKPTDGEWRLIFVPIGLLLNQVVVAMRKLFKVWLYTEDLDASVVTNARTSAVSYAVWVRVGVEPDEKYLGQSTRQADLDGKIGMTVLERLVFGLKHFVETKATNGVGQHLDIKGWTICSGSRDADGAVPAVCFDPGTSKVEVYWCSLGYSNPSDGLRSAVSL